MAQAEPQQAQHAVVSAECDAYGLVTDGAKSEVQLSFTSNKEPAWLSVEYINRCAKARCTHRSDRDPCLGPPAHGIVPRDAKVANVWQ